MVYFFEPHCRRIRLFLFGQLKRYNFISFFMSVAVILATALIFSGCSSKKFLSKDERILSSVSVKSDDKHFNAKNYLRYVRQKPNSRWFGVLKVPLGVYCLASKDTVRHKKNIFRKIGEAPVVYDSLLTKVSADNIRSVLYNTGYLHARVDVNEIHNRHKTKVEYLIIPGDLYTVDKIVWNVENEGVRNIIKKDSASSLLHAGMACDVGILSSERNRIIRLLQDNGYYGINRDFVTFSADTSAFSKNVALSVRIAHVGNEEDSIKAYKKYNIENVNVYCNTEENDDSNASENDGQEISKEPLKVYDYDILLKGNKPFPGGGKFRFYGSRILRHKTLMRNIDFRPGTLFNQTKVENTYRNLGNISIVNFATVRMVEPAASVAESNASKQGITLQGTDSLKGDSLQVARAGGISVVTKNDSVQHLEANIFIKTKDINTVSFEVEGTNMAGDLGAAAAFSFENRNVFHGGETFGIKLRGAFEAIKGLEGYDNNENYIEGSVEMSLKMPLLVLPFRSSSHKRNSMVNSEVSVIYNSQDRPEFHRRTLTAGWRYTWSSWQKKLQHRFDFLSLNYVFMPWISEAFRRDYLDNTSSRNSVLRYSYEDLFIMRSAYNVVFNSQGSKRTGLMDYNSNSYQIRLGVETAGNFLYLISKLFNGSKNEDGHYKLFNIAFAQYAKFDFDFVKNFVIDNRNALAFHVGFGLALPYGNATIIPYEKRYFAGGANSVRGWGVRELGPGKYIGRDGKVDFINQTGNIKFDINLEYRTYLFWKLHGAVFVDAGNVWTTRDYSDQQGGKFTFDNFYKQIAVAYGLGLRLNLDYFVLRFDGGMKAVNPVYSDSRRHFPIIHPKFSRDFTFHFAVGLPF